MKRRIFNILLFIGIFAIVLEISARIDDKMTYNAPFWGKYNYSVLIADDQKGIRHNVRNARFEKWKINSLGFRGREIEPIKSGKSIRIVCFGASETFGLFEDPGKEWPAQLAKMLEMNFPDVEVVNASVVGLNSQKRKDYLRKYVLWLKPDVMIIYQGFFDYAAGLDLLREKEKKGAGDAGREKGRIIEKISSSIRIIPKIKETLKRCIPEKISGKIKVWRIKRQISEIERGRLGDGKARDGVPEGNILRFEKDFEDLILYLKRKDIVPILSTYPTLVTDSNKDKYKLISMDHRRFFIQLSEQGLIDATRKLNEAIARVAEKESCLFVDNNGLIIKTDEYFGDYVHYTNRGAGIIAKNFYTLINHSGLLEKIVLKARKPV